MRLTIPNQVMKALLSLFSIVFLVQLQAQPFVRVYGGSADEPAGFGSGFSGAPAVSAAYSPDGFIYLLTYTASNDKFINLNRGSEDVWILKLTLNGDTVWSKTYGGSGNERAYQIKLLSDNTLGIAGKTTSNDGQFPGAKGDYDGFFMRINADGDLIQFVRLGGSLPDGFYGFFEDENNTFVLFGETGSVDGDINQTSHAGSLEAWVVKITTTGSIAWQDLTSGIVNNEDWIETFWDGLKLPGINGYIFMGVTGNFNDFNTDNILIAKYNPVGEKDFVKVYGSEAQDAPGGIAVKGNELFVTARVSGNTGDVTDYNGGGADFWLLKTDLEADLIWSRSYGGSDVEYPYGISIGQDGKVNLTGVTRSTNNFAAAWEPKGAFDAWLVQVNSDNGDTLLTRRIGGTETDFAHYFLPLFDDSGYLVGRTRSNDGDMALNNGGADVFLSRVSYTEPLAATSVKTLAFQAYPNPASTQFNINLSEWNSNTNIQVINSLGQVIYSSQFSGANHQIQTDNWSAGTYVVVLNNANQIGRLKLVKQ